MKQYLQSIQKQNQQQKKSGNIDSHESDPILLPFYIYICKWCVEKGYMLLWAFTVCQWNNMSRSINIDGLTWNMFHSGTDSIILKYYDTKTDPKGEKCTPKNCYANPFNYFICICTALGCFFIIYDEKFNRADQDEIFKHHKTKSSTASRSYCSQLAALFKEMGARIHQWVREGHGSGHGLRKGAAILCTSGTTCPPPGSTVANRGEWSIGKVFDIYWLFAEAGDHYCGRILAGLDSLSTNFDVLPPHFIEGYENKLINDAIESNFPCIIKLADKNPARFSSIRPLILRVFASVVYHSDALMSLSSQTNGHPFLNMPIFNDPNLPALKLLVTIYPSSIISTPTGIPPHVFTNKKLDNLAEEVKEIKVTVRDMVQTMVDTANDAFEKKERENGHLTSATIKEILNDQYNKHTESMAALEHRNQEKLQLILDAFQGSRPYQASPVPTSEFERNVRNDTGNNNNNNYLHHHGGKYWHVPSNFGMFPKECTRRKGWHLWLQGLPNFRDSDGHPAPIMPFKLMNPKMLPGKLRGTFSNDWQPIYNKMMKCPDLPEAVTGTNPVPNDQIGPSFELASSFLSIHVASFIWNHPTKYKKKDSWSVATWSKNTKYSFIMKNGSDNDIANLPEASRFNRTRKRKR